MTKKGLAELKEVLHEQFKTNKYVDFITVIAGILLDQQTELMYYKKEFPNEEETNVKKKIRTRAVEEEVEDIPLECMYCKELNECWEVIECNHDFSKEYEFEVTCVHFKPLDYLGEFIDDDTDEDDGWGISGYAE